jgi:translation initiation factor IF-2
LPIRIYALAKELKIDNKKLVDICTKAGITGKGSALASLSDEETARLKAFMAGGKAGRGDGPTAGRAGTAGSLSSGTSRGFRREDYVPPAGSVPSKVPILPPRSEKPAALKKKPEEPPAEVAAPPEEPLDIETLIEQAPELETTAEPEVVLEAVPEAELEAAPEEELEAELETETEKPPERDKDRLPERENDWEKAWGKGRDKGREKEKEKRKKPAERPATVVHMAPLPPQAKRPPSKAKPKEPAPQKPDIKLPLDAIRASKAGTKPLSEHIRQHEQKKKERDAAAKRVSPRKPGAAGDELGAGPPPAPATPGRERPRRGARPAVATTEETEETGVTALGGREQRQLKRKRAATVKRRPADEEEEPHATTASVVTPRRMHIRRTGANTAAPRKGRTAVTLPCTVRSFSEAVGVPARTILAKLLALGTMTNIAATLERETAELVAVELGVEVDFHREANLEDQLLQSLEQLDDPATLMPRPPIVTFLGHVDHGKTSLLDRIIGMDVAAHEKGGITQCIRAYRIAKDGRAITFVDTPGHEAFTAMRARGANVTDIAVLVVAADDGVMPQTEEAISHARAAGVPIVVALNKIDLPGLNIDRVYQQLAVNELLPSEWGGETELVKTSAATGVGIDSLLETLLTVAELHEYRANFNRPAQGTCLESEMHEDRGVMAKLLVQSGTLHAGDVVVCGAAYGRIKALYETLPPHHKCAEADPSTPVNVTGLSEAPGAGDRFYVLPEISRARHLAQERAALARAKQLGSGREHVTLENLYERLGQQDQVQTLNIILRADVRGSIEAIRKEMGKLQHPEVQIKVLQATVGGISEADVHLADASDAVIIGFNVVADETARGLADQLGVQVRRYDIIYQVTEDLRAALEGMLRPEKLVKDVGRALVQQLFHISRVGTAAGCRVLSGAIPRDSRVRVIRDSRVIGEYAIDSLRREKDDAREVREGLECGIKLAGFNDLKEGDVLEAYKIEEVRRSLADGLVS